MQRTKLALVYVLMIAACGSRTALVGDESEESSADDSGVTRKDAAQIPRDADVKLDGAPDVFRNDCLDPSDTYIYLISYTEELYSYDPAAGIFRDIGTVDCPTFYDNAFSMAVDRKGTAYVLLYNQAGTDPAQGGLYKVSTKTAKCESIPSYVSGQQNFQVYGTGFATNGGGPSETFYVQGAGDFGSGTGLATIDTDTFDLTLLGNSTPPIFGGELTGTGDGRLFGFFFYESDQTSFLLGELDKTNGQLLSQTPVTGIPMNNGGFSVAFWGGDFYFFTVPDGMSTIATRYRTSDQSYLDVATLSNARIVGAGVSTCAPQ
jgi:hypothetical protein